MHERALGELLAAQDGVVSRRQLLGLGATDADLDRMLRRRRLARLLPGVYVDHTGPATWRQRAWAAVLYAAPAALCLDSATSRPDPDQPVHVAIDATRRVREQPGVRVHRVVGLDRRVRWAASPPRVRVEDNVVELASRAPSLTEAVAVLTDAVNRRETTAPRLVEALGRRARTRRRRDLERVLADVAAGTSSVLEHAYLVRVERAHGLPRAVWQVAREGRRGREYRDAEYPAYGISLELDGRGAHASWSAGERDAERDLADAAAGRVTVRLRYGQVLDRPCTTAGQLAALLRTRGWIGIPRRCGPGCRLPAYA